MADAPPRPRRAFGTATRGPHAGRPIDRRRGGGCQHEPFFL